MNNQIENENNTLTGELEIPNTRMHLFTSIDALTDFVKVFKITDFNVRYGQISSGKMVYQLTYNAEKN